MLSANKVFAPILSTHQGYSKTKKINPPISSFFFYNGHSYMYMIIAVKILEPILNHYFFLRNQNSSIIQRVLPIIMRHGTFIGPHNLPKKPKDFQGLV